MNNKSGSIFNLLQIQDAHFQFLYLHCTLLHLNLAYAQQWRRVTSTVWPWNSPADETCTCTADAHCLETLPLTKHALLTPTALKLSHWWNMQCWHPLPGLEAVPLMKHAMLTPTVWPWDSPTDEKSSADAWTAGLWWGDQVYGSLGESGRRYFWTVPIPQPNEMRCVWRLLSWSGG